MQMSRITQDLSSGVLVSSSALVLQVHTYLQYLHYQQYFTIYNIYNNNIYTIYTLCCRAWRGPPPGSTPAPPPTSRETPLATPGPSPSNVSWFWELELSTELH